VKQTDPPVETLIDYVTGRPKPDIGAEANRQLVERYLVDTLGYRTSDIEVDAPIRFDIDGQTYASHVDLVVKVRDRRLMVIKCASGSLDSREREVVAAARLLDAYQIPLAVASDGHTALIWDTLGGKRIGQGLDAIPSRSLADNIVDRVKWAAPDTERTARSKLVFRSYDSMNINTGTRAGTSE
jgi:hypothetical protein